MKRTLFYVCLVSAMLISTNYMTFNSGFHVGYGRALDTAIVIMKKTNKSDSTITRLIIKAPKDTVTYILTPKRWYK